MSASLNNLHDYLFVLMLHDNRDKAIVSRSGCGDSSCIWKL